MEELLEKVKHYIRGKRVALIERAYDFAAEAHQGQVRKSGEPYLEHPLQTAMLLAELQLDASTIAAALLHDVPENCDVPIEEIEEKFGKEVAELVDGTTKLGRISLQTKEEPDRTKKSASASATQADNLRKMFVAMAKDIRVVLIKLADRLHNMRTLAALPRQKRQQISQETIEIYAPLAHRLGMWEMKWQLEDLSFRYLQPERYKKIGRLVAAGRTNRERYIDRVIHILQQELERVGIHAEITGRPKHIYSIHTKMEKYAAQGKHFSDIYDLFALRILVDEVKDCYSALGIVHSLWHPLPGQFDDYIANAKDNMYQSLQTTVMCLDRKPLEIQIRTHEMHRIAEYGIASHWRYKEGSKTDLRFDERIAWLRQLMEWQKEFSGAEEFVESVKTDIFGDQVFVYTPKGDVKGLPAGATPLDFAYRIHTDLGHRCIGAKVNGRLVSLNHQLQNGDMVEIISSKADRGPSLDWLNPHLGYVNTAHSRQKIRQWFNRQARSDNIERGKELLEKELRRLGIALSEQENIARLFKHDSLDDFLAALGSDSANVQQIAVKLTAQHEPPPPPEAPPQRKIVSPGVQVLGVGDLLTQLARCCNPVPGDAIVGFITRTRGVSIHRKDCPNIINEDEKERIVSVNWGDGTRFYPVPVQIEAWDRVGLLRDISTVVSEEKVNMVGVTTIEHENRTVSIYSTLETTGLSQLSRLLSKLEGVRGVIGVTRNIDGQNAETK